MRGQGQRMTTMMALSNIVAWSWRTSRGTILGDSVPLFWPIAVPIRSLKFGNRDRGDPWGGAELDDRVGRQFWPRQMLCRHSFLKRELGAEIEIH